MRLSQRSLYYGLPLIVIIILFILWRGFNIQSDSSLANLSNKSFPSINLPIISDSAKRFTNDNLIGRVSLVNLWASWCTACQLEHNVLVWIKQNFPFAIYGVNFQDDPNRARAMLDRLGNPYDIVVNDDMGSTALALNVDVLPKTYVVDSRGKIRYVHVGALDQSIFRNTILPIIQKIENE